MNDTYAAEETAKHNINESFSASTWKQNQFQNLASSSLASMVKAFGFAVSLVASPVTVIIDPWQTERRKRDATVTMSIYHEILGRIISRAEALRIAREILERAESERLSFVNYEAARGIQWEDHP